MSNFIGYKCSICGTEYGPADIIYTCEKEGGNLDVIIDFDELQKKGLNLSPEPSIWRYLPLLPVTDPGCHGTPLGRVGATPIYSLSGTGQGTIPEGIDPARVFVKDESFNPTASFKDRASAVVVARAKESGSPMIVTASTGNAGAALAGMAAAAGEKAVIFAPKTAPPAKLAQAKVFGAKVILVEGNYDSAGALALEAAEHYGWYSRNTGYNPFTVEGKKTAAFEIWEAMESGLLDHGPEKKLSVFVSVGDGNIISGIHKGFKDLQALGWIDEPPEIIGVQAEGSSAIADAWERGDENINPVSSTTKADSISVDMPADGVRALRAARETGGRFIKVSDDEIFAAIGALGRAGIFAEPAGAAAYAGFVKAVQVNSLNDSGDILVMNTGSGLKDVTSVNRIDTDELIVEPNLSALKKVLS